MLKKILLTLVAALILLQFFRPSRNIATGNQPDEITASFNVPDNVKAILVRSCYDCHSNNSAYPWYTNIQPVGLWMQHHIDEGKEELNFSVFKSYTLKRQVKKFREIADEVTEGAMPLSSYTSMHKDAVLSAEDVSVVSNWANSMADNIELTMTTKPAQ